MWPQMIRCHAFDRLAAEEPDSIEPAVIQQHLQEARIVAGRGHEAAAARFESRRLFHIDQLHPRAGVSGIFANASARRS